LALKAFFGSLWVLSSCAQTGLKKNTQKTLKPATNKDLTRVANMRYLILPQRYGSGVEFQVIF
jgi:hypothetical protein